MMPSYDLCLAWNWEYDADFVTLLESACLSQGLSLLQITPDTLADAAHALENGQLSFRALLDRASDSDARFGAAGVWARQHAAHRINPAEHASHTADKATMHLALIGAGLYTPYTITLPSYQEQPDLPSPDLSPLGERFAIKPACGGGGEGVVMEATAWPEVLAARQAYPADRYLLQAHIAPVQLGSHPAWFRAIYCAGQAYPCWWHPDTHRYTPLNPAEESECALGQLHEIAAALARLCQLELFSTEIALTGEGLFVVVDYINDPIDLRLQSKAFDGVPDEIVHAIAQRLAGLVAAGR